MLITVLYTLNGEVQTSESFELDPRQVCHPMIYVEIGGRDRLRVESGSTPTVQELQCIRRAKKSDGS